ncbi:MAG: signal peptide peptidase SppA [Pirellulales bacterium]|nr:signal peptide peptidase SppA [Pirellulales bacterium]
MTDLDPNAAISANNPRPTASQTAPPQIILQQKASLFGRFGKLLIVMLGIAVFVILGMSASYRSYFNMTNGPQEKFHSLARDATNKVAIISVAGTIIEGNGFVKKQIDRVKKDDDVVGVVLRINSPGGTITGSDYLYHYLKELVKQRESGDKKFPIVVSMGSMCASGGYYIAMAVGNEPDSIFAEPTTWTGSIGVIIPHYDISGLLKNWDVQNDSIASGPLKQMGSPTKPMNAEEREVLQELVDLSFDDFKKIIQAGRPAFKESPKALDDIATGQIYTATQALQLGLVDKIGFIEAAIDRVAELSGHDLKDLRCVQYQKQTSALDALMGAQTRSDHALSIDLVSLLNFTTPRAYYLYTGLPSLLTNTPLSR